MYSYISLKVECPNCQKSLMDKKKLVDEMPSIKLIVSINNTKGTIRLSSFYGSYNYLSDIDITHDKEYTFSCPKCKTKIESDIKCNECSATLVPLNIIGGGVVKFCSRAGCKRHQVGFEDLTNIHSYFHEKLDENIIVASYTEEEAEEQKVLIRSGTFLRIYCPHCKNSTIEKGSAIFRIINENNETGYLMLSPYLNLFTNESTIFIPEAAVVKDIQCPNCKTSLLSKDKTCEDCESQAVEISVAALTKLIDFYFCSKKGCHWHSLDENDLKLVMLEDNDY